MHRYSLSSFSLRPAVPARRLAPRDLFWSTGKHLRQLRGGGPPPGLRFSYEAGAHLPRFSLACQLRVPLSASPTLLFASLSSVLTSRCRSLSVHRRPAPSVFLSPSLVTVLLHAPVFILSSAPLLPAPLSLGYDLLHPVVLVPATSYIPSSVLAHSTFPSQLLSFRSY